MDNKSTEKPSTENAEITPPAEPAPVKRKLSLDIDDVSEVLERKISPGFIPTY